MDQAGDEQGVVGHAIRVGLSADQRLALCAVVLRDLAELLLVARIVLGVLANPVHGLEQLLVAGLGLELLPVLTRALEVNPRIEHCDRHGLRV